MKDGKKEGRRGRAVRRAAVTLTTLFSMMGAALAISRERPPDVPPPKPPVLPAPFVRDLPNGLKLVVVERRSLPILTLQLVVQSGAEADPPDLPGTAQLTAELLAQGTPARDARAIAETVDSMGANLASGAGWGRTYVELTVLSHQADTAFGLLADIVRHPAFLPEEIDRKRQQTISALEILRDDPAYMADAIFKILVHRGTPYGHPLDGTAESVRRMTQRDLQEFHGRNYRPGNSILAVVGDTSTEDAVARAEKLFGGWKGSALTRSSPAPKTRPAMPRRILIVDKPDATQTEIRVGNSAARRDSPDYYALTVANQVLGGPAANRLFRELRSRQGLAYGASSDLIFQQGVASWVAKTSTRTRETARSLQAVLEEIARLRTSPISHQELETAKSYLIGHMALEFETSDDVAAQTLELVEHRLPLHYWNEFPEKIYALQAPDVVKTARRYLQDDGQVIVLVGDARQFSKELREIGSHHIVPLEDLDLAAADFFKGER